MKKYWIPMDLARAFRWNHFQCIYCINICIYRMGYPESSSIFWWTFRSEITILVDPPIYCMATPIDITMSDVFGIHLCSHHGCPRFPTAQQPMVYRHGIKQWDIFGLWSESAAILSLFFVWRYDVAECGSFWNRSVESWQRCQCSLMLDQGICE